ncbi:type II secretion system F family protein [bacterium]|nr:type II secretion system F family protein [bacterium]
MSILDADKMASAPLRLSRQRVVIITRQLTTMVQAGVGLVESWEAVSRSCQDFSGRTLANRIVRALQRGERLSLALSRQPLIFSPLYVAVMQVAEETGQLATCLGRLADWQERDMLSWRRFSSAMVYPACVVALAGALTLALFCGVLPGLLESLEKGPGLPWITRLLMSLTWAARSPAVWTIALAFAGEAFLTLRRIRQHPDRWARLYGLLRRLPALGTVLQNMALARFCAGLRTTLAVGTPLMSALKLAGQAADDPVVNQATQTLIQLIREGEPLHEAIAAKPEVFPRLMVHLTAVAEESGGLVQLLDYLERYYEREAEERVAMMQTLVEPFLLISVASLVAAVVLAIFLPLYTSLATLAS